MSDNGQQSLYEYIKTAIEPLNETGGLPKFSLPPDTSSSLPFADGAKDGIAMYHMGNPGSSDETRALMKDAVQTASEGKHKEAERLFAELGRSASALSLIDELQDHIIENRETIPANELCNFAVYATTRTSDRECVKFALSILELLNIEDNERIRDIVTLLGLSDEFTLFSVFVMSRWSGGNENIVYLARNTRGWGRIHAIERLKPDTPELRQWLLREGVHNTVLPAYSALTCWNKSGAAELLRSPEELSDEDFHGLRDIIDALLDEGPCAGISEVDNSDEILALFLKRAGGRTLDIDDYEVIRNIRLHDEENDVIATLSDGLLNTEKCRECVKLAVKEGKSIGLAKNLGIDCSADILELLETDIEKNAHLCGHLLDDDEYRAKVIAAFREKLPLGEMKAAPTTGLCLGQEFKKEQALDFIVQHLGNFPCEGADLIETALQCAPSRNRSMALNALQGWVNSKQTPLEALHPEMYALLRSLKDGEPGDKLRERMEKLISGEIDEK